MAAKAVWGVFLHPESLPEVSSGAMHLHSGTTGGKVRGISGNSFCGQKKRIAQVAQDSFVCDRAIRVVIGGIGYTFPYGYVPYFCLFK